MNEEVCESPVVKYTFELLAIGDRVRLNSQCKSQRYQVGETGTIVWVSRWGYYHVRMDRQRGVPLVSFRPDEVDPVGTV
jgi:hypothetical protein